MSDSIISPAFVYIIQAESGPVKIGVANNTEQRLAAHQSSNHELLTLLYSFACSSNEQARAIELALHHRYKDQNIRGEWFSVEPDNIIADLEFFVELCVAVNNIIIEYIVETPKEKRLPKAPGNPRVNLREIARKIHENGDTELRAADWMEKYNISMGSTTKIRGILKARGEKGFNNGHGNEVKQ